jgi:pyrimidine operon attenuation protein/uracil phosphoribosyltransferase
MISFVVPAYNEERLIGRTLASIHAAVRPLTDAYELIVVDDGSTDETGAIAAAHRARVIRVQFRQIARTRNAGARAATGETLIFVDADTLVSTQTIGASLDALRNGAAGGGANVDFDGELAPWARLTLPVVRAVMRTGRLAAGCYMFCTRRAFDRVGGFDETLYASEEIAFSRALKRHGRVVILNEPVLTSGRKLRADSGAEVVRLCGRMMRYGLAVVRSREHLSVWYGVRPDDHDGDLERLASRFVAATLPKPEWTHLAHLKVGAWHVDRYGPAEALARLRTRITRLNERHGTINSASSGYHETITRAYVRLLAQFLDACPPGLLLGDRAARLVSGPLADKNVLFAFYSRDRLMSPRARAEWVEPDLAPLELRSIL